MVKTLLISGYAVGQATTASTTEYFPLSGYLAAVTTTEAHRDIIFRSAGTLAQLYVRIPTNATTAQSTIRTRKNAANGGQTITVNSGATGEFEDTSGTDTVAAADKLCLQTVTGAGGSMNLRIVSTTFAATTDTVSVTGIVGPFTTTTASTTWFFPIEGYSGNNTTTETFQKCRMRKAGTFKNAGVYVSAARAQATTVRSRKNAANGNLVVTCTASTTGWFEDTSNTDTVSAAEDWDISVTTGTGADTLTIQTMKIEFVSTGGNGVSFVGKPVGVAVNDATTAYFPLGGTCDSNTTESNTQMKARVAFTLSEMVVVVSQNDVSSASTCDLRQGAASTAVTISITGNLTGLFQDNSHSVTLAATDEINFRLVVPSVSGSHTVTLTNIGIHTAGGNDYTRSITTETVSLSESIARLLAANRTDTETTTITETPTRMIAANRTLATETISLSESIAKEKCNVRPVVTESVTISESSLNRMLAATRANTETTSSTETTTRLLSAFRTLPTETVTITDSVARVRGAVATIQTETVTITDSVNRLLAANRALNETTSVSDSVARVRGINRTLATETVTISDSVARLLAATRAIAIESTTISDQLDRTRGVNRTISESVILSEQLTRLLTASRTISIENTSIIDSLIRLLAVTRAINTETTTITDQVSRIYTPVAGNFARSLSETTTITDSITRMLTATRTIDIENITISENLTRLLAASRTVGDTTTINDSLVRSFGAVRLMSESVTITEQLIRMLASNRLVSETTNISGQLVRMITATRSLPETVAISEQLARILAAVRAVEDTENITDSVDYLISQLHDFVASLTETVNITDSVFAYSLLQRYRGALNRYLKGEWSISDPTREDIS